MTNKAAQLACDWGQFAASEVFSEPEQLLAAFSSTPTVGFAIFDNQLRYQAVNQALVEINGIPADAHLGKTVRQVFGDAIAERVEPAFEHVLTTGQRLQFEITAKLPSRTEVGHWIDNCVPLRDATGTVRQLGVVVVEVTNRKRLEQSAPSLSSRLLRIRDTEQRRVARELHDSVNQNHAALKMNLGLLSRPRCKPADRESLLAQSVDLLEQCISKTRTISHLLHPPLLDEKGFASAARWYVKGFSQRSGIQVNVNCTPEQERMRVRVEIALFRILQEALSNAYRHAHTSVVDVYLERKSDRVSLVVQDHGQGIPAEELQRLQTNIGGGVGVSSMRERIHELRGVFEIQSDSSGTVVSARVPLYQKLVRPSRNGKL